MAFADLFRRAEKRSTGNETLAALGAHWLGTPSSKYPAEQLAVTAACVQVIAGQLAGLPVHVYRFEGDKRVEAPSHPFARLVRRGPNAWQSWPSWVEWMAASALIFGSGLAEIVSDRAGRVVELRPIRWGLWRRVGLSCSKAMSTSCRPVRRRPGRRRRSRPRCAAVTCSGAARAT